MSQELMNLLDVQSGAGNWDADIMTNFQAIRDFVKTFNIVGLPIAAVFVGAMVWISWISRKKRIQLLFLDPPTKTSKAME